MLTAVSLRYPVVFAYICKNLDFTTFFLKTNEIIGFLIPESIRIDILFMTLAYVVAKLFVNMLFLYTLAAILDFAILEMFSTTKKMQALFFLIFMIFRVRFKWKINFNRQNARKCYMWHMSLHYNFNIQLSQLIHLHHTYKYKPTIFYP